MTKFANRVLPRLLVIIAFSVPVLCQQEVDPSYYAPVPSTTAPQPSGAVVRTMSEPKQVKPALVPTAYHPNASRAKVRKAAAVKSGNKNSTRK